MTSRDQIMAHLRVIAGTQSLAEAQREAREAITVLEAERAAGRDLHQVVSDFLENEQKHQAG